MRTPQISIAREGYPFIFFSAFVTLTLALIGLVTLTLLGLVCSAFVLWFFRDPDRIVPDENDGLICPADGKVIILEKIFDERFLKQEVYKLSIFMNVFNVHVNRVPLDGSVERVFHRSGKFYSADTEKGALQNEFCATRLTTGSGRSLVFVQVAGLIARRIINRLEPGDKVRAGQRFGLIRFGSRVDLYLPLDTEFTVSVGDKVRAGESLLGRLK
ncbi:MAG: phosphatidylserine decarboxylase family protein [Thermodesulfobacteriota bacterium]